MKFHKILAFSVLSLVVSLAFAHKLYAVEYTSTNFIVKDPVLGGIAGQSSSSLFNLFSSGEFVVTGRSSSGSNIGRFGFLYFPFATAPTLSATDGNAEADLSWSASSSGLGFNVSGYEVGQSTASNGPYTYTNVGNVTSSTRTGLTNGTTYYFIVRTLDAFGNSIAVSNEVTATPSGAAGGGGGGGSSGSTSTGPIATGVQFTGEAYPGATVVFLKNGIERARTKADEGGVFKIVIEEIFDNTVLYTLYAFDQDGVRSLLLNYPILIKKGVSSLVSGIRFAPTIIADKIEVKRGEDIIISGFALPLRPLILNFKDSGPDTTLNTGALASGRYKYILATKNIPKDEYEVRAQYQGDSRVSNVVEFTVGDATVFRDPTLNVIRGDCNKDRVIDLKDFSVLAFWYGKENPPVCIDTNGDGTVNLVDFSILAFYWSG